MSAVKQWDRRQIDQPSGPRLGARGHQPWLGAELASVEDLGFHVHPDYHDGWAAIRERSVPLAERRRGFCPNIIVTSQDKQRLERVLRTTHWHSQDPGKAAALRRELNRATIVESEKVPPDVVTMKSHVVCQDTATGARSELRLVYPWEAPARKASLSILSPLGLSLLGMRAGHPIELPQCSSWRPSLRLASLRYQPEREGHFHL